MNAEKESEVKKINFTIKLGLWTIIQKLHWIQETSVWNIKKKKNISWYYFFGWKAFHVCLTLFYHRTFVHSITANYVTFNNDQILHLTTSVGYQVGRIFLWSSLFSPLFFNIKPPLLDSFIRSYSCHVVDWIKCVQLINWTEL